MDATFGRNVELESEPWFPRKAVTSVTDSDGAPTGFTAHTLHVRWDSLPMLLPEGEPDTSSWWSNLSATWGDWVGGNPISCTSNSIGWIVEFPKYEAQILPLDEDGHGRRLSELNCTELHTAIGGIQHEGRDVILIFEKKDTAPLPLDDEHLRMAGATLGRFHALCARNLSTPNDERAWNKRLDILEPRTRSATKWRAPHSADTQGTITHRNFGLENCHLMDGRVIIRGCVGGIYNALLPETSPSPALRDVAAGVQGLSREDRHAFCEGWTSTAPEHWSSSKALDSHRGGLIIWEYEQHLEQRLFHQSWGLDEPEKITHFLASVSSVQNRMYQARTLAAAGLICLTIPPVTVLYWLFYPDAANPSIFDGTAMFALLGIGGLLRRMYRAAAPKPW